MVNPDNQSQSSGRTTASTYLDALLRIVALFLGFVFLIGALWSAKDGSYPNITGLSQAILMFVCVVSPRRPSRLMLVTLLIVAMVAGTDFVVRAVPSLRVEDYPTDVVLIYVAELVVAIWFIAKAVLRFGEWVVL